ncbi:MAG: HAMP domain-containing protein [Microcoleus sp. SM1_3_4]|nr:HAMP domain-containing protein [Microcoleus sp. SM1_3_4]
MSLFSTRCTSKQPKKIPLRFVLVASFVLQIVGTVGLVGYLSFRNGHKAVENLAQQLMGETSKRIEEKLTNFLETAYLANQLNSAAIARGELNFNLEQPQPQSERFLWHQMQTFKNIQWISLGSETGEYLGIWRNQKDNSLQIVTANSSSNFLNVYYATDAFGNRGQQLHRKPEVYDARQRPWYKEAIAANKPMWTSIYPGFTPGTVYMAVTQPIRDRTGKLLGVCAVDISLSDIQNFLDEIKLSQKGQIFAIEHSGMLVASSSGEFPFQQVPGKQELQRLHVLDSQTPLIRVAAEYLYSHFQGFDKIQGQQQLQFTKGGERYFVEVLPLSNNYGLKWSIAIAVPESDFMAEINSNTRTTILLCLAALLVSTTAGVLVARWVTLPLLRLNEAAKAIAKGEFDRTVGVSRVDEVGELAQSFNEMVVQLKNSFQALAQSEEKFAKLLECLPVGVIALTPAGSAIFMNSMGGEITGKGAVADTTPEELSATYQLYVAGTDRLYPIEDSPFERAVMGKETFVEDMELRRDGKVIRLQVRSQPMFDDRGNVIYALIVFQDITARKQAEQILADYNRRLEMEVTSRTIELAEINARLELEIEERKQAEKNYSQRAGFQLKYYPKFADFFCSDRR